MEFIKALTLSIGAVDEPVVTRYRLGLIIHHLYLRKRYKGEAIKRIKKGSAEKKDVNKYINQLLNEGVLAYQRGLSSMVFTLLGRTIDSVEDVVCSIDPFSYISHLSAMEYHGLSNRMPSKLYVSSPSAKQWKAFAEQRMAKDLGETLDLYRRNGMPLLLRTQYDKVKIKKKEIYRFNSIHLGAYNNLRGRPMRVSSIGRTFLDMLKNPELCGGISHVLEVYEEQASDYLKLIIDEIDQHGGPIDKVRAGYILDERIGLQHEQIEGWLQFVQRGGSRKLDASKEYIPKWSDKWCLSLNVF